MVEQAQAALKRHGSKVEVRVITFYNMQKRELERQFEGKSDICRITISSVSMVFPCSSIDDLGKTRTRSC